MGAGLVKDATFSDSDRGTIIEKTVNNENESEKVKAWLNEYAVSNDPWYNMPVEEQFLAVTENLEDLPLVEIESSLNGATSCELIQASRISVPDEYDEVFFSDATQWNFVVAVDVSGNQIIENPWRMMIPWARYLDISASVCGISNGLNLFGLSKLLVLDMSYINLDLHRDVDFSPVAPTLRKLIADGCGWSVLPKSMSLLVCLQYLSLKENQISDPDVELQSKLQTLVELQELDMRDNIFWEMNSHRENLEYAHIAMRLFPKLIILDNKIVNSKPCDVSYSEIQDDSAGGAIVADNNEDRGSCSCMEGTPCEVEYTCKDWAHRFEIADYARNH